LDKQVKADAMARPCNMSWGVTNSYTIDGNPGRHLEFLDVDEEIILKLILANEELELDPNI
jgi:hypothetical protein